LQTSPVSLIVRFYIGKHRRGRKPDLDNLVKLVQDALSGILYRDDSQVSTLTACRFVQEATPRTEIEWNSDA
jgi:Holliday junction resolvase RusA-like endonuclease